MISKSWHTLGIKFISLNHLVLGESQKFWEENKKKKPVGGEFLFGTDLTIIGEKE